MNFLNLLRVLGCLVFAALVVVAPPALAFQRMGDWESSGNDPGPVYVPKYAFQYSCQVEVSDLRLHKIAGPQSEEDRVYAVARFELNPQKRSVRGHELDWKTLVENSETREDEVIARPLPFSIDELGLYLVFNQGHGGASDRVTLVGSISLRIGNQFVPQDDRALGTRDDESLQVRSYISSYVRSVPGKKYRAGNDGQTRKMFAICQKVK